MVCGVTRPCTIWIAEKEACVCPRGRRYSLVARIDAARAGLFNPKRHMRAGVWVKLGEVAKQKYVFATAATPQLARMKKVDPIARLLPDAGVDACRRVRRTTDKPT